MRTKEVDPEERQKELAKRLEEAKENIMSAQEKQKERYDHKHANPENTRLILLC